MKCQIQWIDKKGNPTPDQNDAVCIAVNRQCSNSLDGGAHEREFFCCAKHAIELEELADKGMQVSQYGTNQWFIKPLAPLQLPDASETP